MSAQPPPPELPGEGSPPNFPSPPQQPSVPQPPYPQQPSPQQQPYQPQQFSPVMQRTNGMAIASLVLGIVGLFLFVFFMIPNILAVVFGFVGLSQIKQAPPGAVAGRGLAIAGLVMGLVGIGLFALLIPFGTVHFHFGGGS